MRFRAINKAYAHAMGYFWLPCPRCGQEWGGHEWRSPYPRIPNPSGLPGKFLGVCGDCAQDLGPNALPQAPS